MNWDRVEDLASRRLPDVEDKLMPFDFNIAHAQLDIDVRKERLESDRQDREERKQYAIRVYYLISFFFVAVLCIVAASAVESIPFSLSDNVLIALLTTSSANVIGLFMIVMKYLFRNDERA
jgi:hypothetical protein